MKDDTELFELCKEVYELTEWDDDSLTKQMYVVTEFGDEYVDGIAEGESFWEFPLYTSDYLLEKLPLKLKHEKYLGSYWLTISPMDNKGTWSACYENNTEDESLHFEFADSALLALLKLTIALHKAGEL